MCFESWNKIIATGFLYPTELPFKIEGEMSLLQNKHKQRKFMTIKANITEDTKKNVT
jgi:hypothetical protein